MRNVYQGMSLIFKVSSSVNNINTNKSMPRYIKDKFKKFKANRVKKKKNRKINYKSDNHSEYRLFLNNNKKQRQ